MRGAALLQVALLDRARVRENALLAADHEDHLVLEPLGVVQRHQRREALLLAQAVLFGDQRDLRQELLQWGVRGIPFQLAIGVELPGDADQLLEVLDPSLGLDGALGLQRLDVPRVAQDRLEQLGHRSVALGALAQARHRVGEPDDRLQRRRAEPGMPCGFANTSQTSTPSVFACDRIRAWVCWPIPGAAS